MVGVCSWFPERSAHNILSTFCYLISVVAEDLDCLPKQQIPSDSHAVQPGTGITAELLVAH